MPFAGYGCWAGLGRRERGETGVRVGRKAVTGGCGCDGNVGPNSYQVRLHVWTGSLLFHRGWLLPGLMAPCLGLCLWPAFKKPAGPDLLPLVGGVLPMGSEIAGMHGFAIWILQNTWTRRARRSPNSRLTFHQRLFLWATRACRCEPRP